MGYQTTTSIQHMWKHLRIHSDTFQTCTSLEIGNGKKVRFWTETWLGSAPLKDQYPLLSTVAQNPEAPISEYWSNSGWDITFRHNINDSEVDSLCFLLSHLHSLPPLLSRDSLHGNVMLRGIFSVISCYTQIIPSHLEKQSSYEIGMFCVVAGERSLSQT